MRVFFTWYDELYYFPTKADFRAFLRKRKTDPDANPVDYAEELPAAYEGDLTTCTDWDWENIEGHYGCTEDVK